MSLCVMLLMRATSTTRASGMGLGPGNLEFFGPQMALAYRLDAISQGKKTLDFQGPTPSHLPSKWMLAASKALRMGSYKS